MAGLCLQTIFIPDHTSRSLGQGVETRIAAHRTTQHALFEKMIYNDDGQPLTTTFADYLLPTAPEVPEISTLYMETPSPLNPLGVKGVGEVGTIPVTAAVISAIEDALSPLNIRITETPILPERLFTLINDARMSSHHHIRT